MKTLSFLLMLVVALAPAEALAKKKGRRPAAPKRSQAVAPLQIIPKEVPTDPAMIEVKADGAILLDAQTGENLWSKNADQRFYPASSTKMLTALLVIEAGDLDRMVTVEEADTKVEPTSIYFKPGEQYSRRELLYALLLKSANDVAQALARDNAGSIEAFGERMTRRAHQLGAVDSQFRNPHGLHDPGHYSTPHDLAVIARFAMQQPTFRKIVSTVYHDWEGGANGPMKLRNTNRLLREFPGCTGLKTGYTSIAGHVLVSAAVRDGREVISVVMHSDKLGKWTDSGLLLTYGLHAATAVDGVKSAQGEAGRGSLQALRPEVPGSERPAR